MEKSIDSLLEPVPAMLFAHDTVGVSLEKLRSTPLGDRIVYFYVVDDEQRLKGVVPTRRLLGAAPESYIQDLMLTDPISLPLNSKVADAMELLVRRKLLALPVADDSGRLVGTISISSLTKTDQDVSQRPLADSAFQLLGLHLARSATASPLSGFVDRFPWLLANIGGGIACALISAQFEGLLEYVIVLALFIPIVLALAESVGMQSATLTLQAILTEGRVPYIHSLFREMKVALLLGGVCGTMVGLIAFAWKGEELVALTIGGAIMLSMITACLLGVLLPLTVHQLKMDPKVAAGPVTLAVSDIATLLFYFGLGSYLLSAV